MNIFPFEYDVVSVQNRNAVAATNDSPAKDATDSRFGIVYGDGGMVVHTKKDSYELVTTDALSQMANAFVEKGLKVSPYVHKYGEVIGLSVTLGKRPTVVGDKVYRAIVHVPNNGGGAGYFHIEETRLICTNGMTRKVSGKKGSVKIPHDLSYPQALSIVQDAILSFTELVIDMEKKDAALNEQVTTTEGVRIALNDWFYQNEVSVGQKKNLTFDEFRAEAFNGTLVKALQTRYDQLNTAVAAEFTNNETLGLKLTKYTTFAIVTNYISRRNEKGGSTAPNEVKQLRLADKVDSIYSILA